MFPDFAVDETLITEEYNVHSVLNAFTEPSCSVQKAVVDLLNVPDQSKELEQRIHAWIPSLTSSDPVDFFVKIKHVFVFRLALHKLLKMFI